MKITLYGAQNLELGLRVLSGGYDAKLGRAVLVVQDETGRGGTLQLDAAEARDVAVSLSRDLPVIERVETSRVNGNLNVKEQHE